MSDEQFPRPWATATDNTGKTWGLRITAADAIALRSRKLVDLLGTDAAKSASAVFADPISAIDVACAILDHQRQASDLTDDIVFLSRWDGDTLQDLLDATVEGIIDFFPSRQQAVLRDMLAKNREVAAAAQEAAAKRLTSKATVEAMKKAAVDEVNAAIDAALSKLTPPRGVTS